MRIYSVYDLAWVKKGFSDETTGSLKGVILSATVAILPGLGVIDEELIEHAHRVLLRRTTT